MHPYIQNIGTCIITIDTILQIFAYPCATRYAHFIGFSGEPHLKDFIQHQYCVHVSHDDMQCFYCLLQYNKAIPYQSKTNLTISLKQFTVNHDTRLEM